MVVYPLGSSLGTSPGLLLGHCVLFIIDISDQGDRKMRGEQDNLKRLLPSEQTKGMKLANLAGGRQSNSRWEDQ